MRDEESGEVLLRKVPYSAETVKPHEVNPVLSFELGTGCLLLVCLAFSASCTMRLGAIIALLERRITHKSAGKVMLRSRCLSVPTYSNPRLSNKFHVPITPHVSPLSAFKESPMSI